MITRSENQSLLVVGSVALDDIDGPFGMQKDLLGGSASFFAAAASYFTDKVSIVAVIGAVTPCQLAQACRAQTASGPEQRNCFKQVGLARTIGPGEDHRAGIDIDRKILVGAKAADHHAPQPEGSRL